MAFPSKIICLTEETVETLYLFGREDLIQGVSEYAVRPEAAQQLPKVSQFIRSDIQKILDLKPDLVIGFSDIQKDIARDLVGHGLNVLITNQRSIEEILQSILLLGRIVDESEKAKKLVLEFRQKIEAIREEAKQFSFRPKVYFEQWHHPRLSAITWVSELIEICGGESLFRDRVGSLAKDRQVSDEEIIHRNPDVIFGCWCGKKVKTELIAARAGYQEITAVKNTRIWELEPEIFLQPGPALFVDGLDRMFGILKKVAQS